MNQVEVGLVLHLDPDELERNGGKYSCSPERRVKGLHFFLIIGVQGLTITCVPLYSNENSPGREFVPKNGRTGHHKWARGSFYFDKNQCWSASAAAIWSAAQCGGDKSTSLNRNKLSVAATEEISSKFKFNLYSVSAD